MDDEAVGGGMGEGSSWLLAVLENEGCVWVLPWALSGLRKGALLLAVPWSLLLRSAMDRLVIAESESRGRGRLVAAAEDCA